MPDHAQLSCRSCGAVDLVSVLDLGDQPLANRLRTAAELAEPEPRVPLHLVMCPSCSLVQISESVSPDILFKQYPYFSSVSPALVAHARKIAERLMEERRLSSDNLVIEIASNDGYLLQHYRDAGVRVLGIDPAENIAAVAQERGIPTRCAFFGRDLADQLVAEGITPDIVHANNVLAHVPDLNGVVAGIATLIGQRGRLVTESPYLGDLMRELEFDTIYHEHLCYYSLTALSALFERHGLVVEDAEHLDLHGGSLRLTVGSAAVTAPSAAVVALLEEESKWNVRDPATYGQFADRVHALGVELTSLLEQIKGTGASLAAYGASAKGATMLNVFGIGADLLAYVADASPHKQGLYTPGTALPIVPPSRLAEDHIDYVLLLAWNFSTEILAQQSLYREAGGKFIIPVPTPTIV